jgi:peptidoglycan/xylan/chitin deacetylase (PgdA/CDA1 family)
MILETISSIIGAPLLFWLAGSFFFGRQNRRTTVPGLLFHSVISHPRSPSFSQYSTGNFRKFLSLVKSEDWHPVPLNRGISLTRETGKNCVITFDDGFRNFYRHAFPVLQEFGFPVSLFIVPGYCGKKATWDVFNGEEHLTINEIREIAAAGNEIGSHTVTHANLTWLSRKDLLSELGDSKKTIEDWTGIPVTSLSFPYGSWNERVWDTARECGYASATLYRNHRSVQNGLLPVHGVYLFDSPADIISRLRPSPFSIAIACARVMSHFSKGTPVWKFRKNYAIHFK